MSNKPKIEEIFKTLGDEISLRLFRFASIGIDSTPQFLQKTGLTRKQFYTRLQKLVKLGLVQKKQGIYQMKGMGNKENPHSSEGDEFVSHTSYIRITRNM